MGAFLRRGSSEIAKLNLVSLRLEAQNLKAKGSKTFLATNLFTINQ